MGDAQESVGLTREAVVKSTVLVVDDQASFHDTIAPYLIGFRVIDAFNGRQALEALEAHHVDLVLLDLHMPDMDGFEVLDRIRAEYGDVEVMIVTSHSDLKNAVQAVKQGAFDFIAKSYENYQQIGQLLSRALMHRRRRRQLVAAAAGRSWVAEAFENLERSTSEAVRAVMRTGRQVAITPFTVLIEGESGVGKEVVARFVHGNSERSTGPFVAVNLAAVPAQLLESHLFGHVKGAFTGADRTHIGKFEQADGGTLFLDEIGELDATAQAKLLRVLQEREVERIGAREAAPVDVRVIAATNKNLRREVDDNRFRDDLYYRLNVVRLPIPPLRERRGDIPVLIHQLVAKHAVTVRREAPNISAAALDALVNFDWPGNVRELENLVMRLVATCPAKEIVLDDIPPEFTLPVLAGQVERLSRLVPRPGESSLYFLAREQFERFLVRKTIRECGGDKRRAAERLGVSLSTVKEKSRVTPGERDPDAEPDDPVPDPERR